MKKKYILVLILALVTAMMGCSSKVEDNLLDNQMDEQTILNGTILEDDNLYFKVGNKYKIQLNDESLKTNKFFIDSDLKDTFLSMDTSEIEARISNFEKKDDQVYAQIEVLTKKDLKVPTPYGFLNYPAELSKNVIIDVYEENGYRNYNFNYMLDDISYPMFQIKFGQINDSTVFTLFGGKATTSGIGLQIQSFDIASDNPVPEDKIQDFYAHQEMLNYIIDNFEFLDEIRYEISM